MLGKLGCVYLVTCVVSGKQYVGMTQRDSTGKKRWNTHLELATKGYKGLLHRSIRKYGREKFSFEILFKSRSFERLQKLERQSIKKLKTMAPNGFNCTEGGLGGLPSEAALKRIGKAASDRWKDPIFRAEMEKKFKKAGLKAWKNKERREAARQRRLGRKHTTKTKNKISEANIRRWKPGGDLRKRWA